MCSLGAPHTRLYLGLKQAGLGEASALLPYWPQIYRAFVLGRRFGLVFQYSQGLVSSHFLHVSLKIHEQYI